jgi:hypothetical protein
MGHTVARYIKANGWTVAARWLYNSLSIRERLECKAWLEGRLF